MGARRHGQDGAFASLWKCCKVFLCINNYSKTLSYELFMHYFHKLSSASGALPPDPHRSSLTGPRWDNRLQTPNLTTPGKNPADAYGQWRHYG